MFLLAATVPSAALTHGTGRIACCLLMENEDRTEPRGGDGAGKKVKNHVMLGQQGGWSVSTSLKIPISELRNFPQDTFLPRG